MAVSDLLFVSGVYLMVTIPCFIIIGVLLFVFKKTTLSRGIKVALFSITSALAFSPVMLPAASIMVLPGPSFYMVADLFSDHGREYALGHLEHYPILTVLSPAITLVLSIVVALKFFPDKRSEPTP